jgi:hydrogenase/urease accessory protein HupE
MRPIAVLTVVLSLCPRLATAHPAPFSYLDVRIGASQIDGTIVVHDFDVAHDLGVDAPETLLDATVAEGQRANLISLLDRRLQLRADGVPLGIEWGSLSVLADRQSLALAFHTSTLGTMPGTVAVDAVIFPYDPIHQTFINIYEGSALRHQAILDFDHRAFTYYSGTTQGTWAVVKTFVPAGIEHILIGPDHVLFLVGLLLLGGSAWRLGGIVTAFTIGHSITLSVAALDLLTPPARLVEPTIALSIVFVGVDNLLVATKSTSPTGAPHDIRAWVAGTFGLVHGFGFASVLKEFGLPRAALGWSLFSFNVGVEIGQLCIVLVVATALAAIRRRYPRLGNGLAWAGSIGVILAGGYWFVQRVFLTGSPI